MPVTDSSGAATGYTKVVTGVIQNVIYTKDDYANGVDFTITTETTGQTIWSDTNVNASETVAPKQAAHSTAGAALVYDTDNAPVTTDIYAVNERVKIVIAQGGSGTAGTFTVIVA